MSNMLNTISVSQVAPFVLLIFTVACLTLIALGVTWAKCWAKVRTHEADVNLKHAMLERGMSAADIERVLQAGRDKLDGDVIH